MDKEGQLWATIWTLVAVVFMSLIVVSSIYFDAKSTKWVNALAKSDNPVALACALKVEEGDQNMPQICALAIK